MRKAKRHAHPGSQIGTSFLLVVFVILCLVIFATLSLSGALRDHEYSKKAAAKTTAYYAADTRAVHLLAEIDEVLAEAKQPADGSAYDKLYLKNAAEKLGQLDGISVDTDEGGHTIVSYKVVIDEAQELQIALELTESSYKIIKWKEVSSQVWEEKTTLPVLGNGEIEEE